MKRIFVIEDEFHAETQGKHGTFEEAIEELKRLAKIPWDKEPNIAPCTSWKTCGRNYKIVEYDVSGKQWKNVKDTYVLDISAKEVKWLI